MAGRQPTFNELLILEVQNHPELYDQQHRVCTDSDERNNMWEGIARRIDENVTAAFAKKRWLQLRDRYRKELKISLRNMVAPKWPYYSKLSWLDQYLKDSKSAGLNTLFTSFDGLESTPNLFIKEESHEIPEFQYTHQLNANTLLENIMAASSSAFEQLQRQRENGKFSPDSTIASNEDGDTANQLQLLANLNSSASTSGSDTGSSGSSDAETKLRHNDSTPERRSSAQSDTSCETDSQQNEPRCPNPQQPFDSNIFSAGTENFSFMGSVIRGLSVAAQQQLKCGKQRNPPYLVRRGGGIKIKPDCVDRPNGLSAFKPLSKTMSVGGLMSQLNTTASQRTNLQFTQSVGLERESKADEWQFQEWSNDEDMLFARLIVLRLKKLPAKDKRNIRSQISDMLDQKEEQVEIN